ncbi:MAG: hypothetical protein HYS26_01135 [Candidatus Kaiserbacteria bacterium]|nr:MAG: hypothetical protein HYS26_01135 [Candidatus Kaiserbacteria bacterium]
MALFGLLALAVYLMYKKEWVLAHIALIPSFLWHFLGSFVLSGELAGNYDYYLFLLAFVLLFVPYKEFFLKLLLVLFYFLASLSKIHESWILGTYFSSLKTGLPLFPDWSIPIWTNLVIFMEMVAAWFLLSGRRLLQRAVFIFFVAFHLYSGIFVGFRYPATVLPTLLILFGPLYAYTPPPLTRRALAGWILVSLMFMAQLSPLLVRGDEKLTLEANKFGLYMFESNHQCVSSATVFLKDGTQYEVRAESVSARSRCDPYYYWFSLRAPCERDQAIGRIVWTFDHSINGGPFLRIVDEQDACSLSYDPFRHNAWIKTETDAPEVIGWPVENVYD